MSMRRRWFALAAFVIIASHGAASNCILTGNASSSAQIVCHTVCDPTECSVNVSKDAIDVTFNSSSLNMLAPLSLDLSVIAGNTSSSVTCTIMDVSPAFGCLLPVARLMLNVRTAVNTTIIMRNLRCCGGCVIDVSDLHNDSKVIMLGLTVSGNSTVTVRDSIGASNVTIRPPLVVDNGSFVVVDNVTSRSGTLVMFQDVFDASVPRTKSVMTVRNGSVVAVRRGPLLSAIRMEYAAVTVTLGSSIVIESNSVLTAMSVVLPITGNSSNASILFEVPSIMLSGVDSLRVEQRSVVLVANNSVTNNGLGTAPPANVAVVLFGVVLRGNGSSPDMTNVSGSSAIIVRGNSVTVSGSNGTSSSYGIVLQCQRCMWSNSSSLLATRNLVSLSGFALAWLIGVAVEAASCTLLNRSLFGVNENRVTLSGASQASALGVGIHATVMTALIESTVRQFSRHRRIVVLGDGCWAQRTRWRPTGACAVAAH